MTEHRAVLGDRSLFDIDAPVFVDHGAISAPSRAVREQVACVLNDYARGGLVGFKRWLPQRARLKNKLASFVGADASDLGFIANTTAGVCAIALCFPWKPGDRVLLFEGDFPANITPWQEAARLFDLEIVWQPIEPFERSVDEGLEALEHTVKEHSPRLIAASLVRFQTGLRMPIEQMGKCAHQHGAQLFVDAIQGLGVLPFDVAAVDYLSCGAHKWLMGLEGVGFLYVAPEVVGALEPRVAGWLSHENALDFLFLGPGHLRHDRPIRREANIVEQGAQNALGCAALEASLDLIMQVGTPTIFDHVQAYHDALEPELLARGFKSERLLHARSGSLCVHLPPSADLGEFHSRILGDIACTTPDGRLRFAPHWPNHLDEVPTLLAAVDRGLAGFAG